jgi:hypothetical protein
MGNSESQAGDQEGLRVIRTKEKSPGSVAGESRS